MLRNISNFVTSMNETSNLVLINRNISAERHAHEGQLNEVRGPNMARGPGFAGRWPTGIIYVVK